MLSKIESYIIKKDILPWAFAILVIFLILNLAYSLIFNGKPNLNETAINMLLLMFTVGTITPILFRIKAIENRKKDIEWMRYHLQKLHSMVVEMKEKEGANIDNGSDITLADKKWPWGDHHTQLLGHLEAAANRYWVMYDPSDPSTAPTNNMVATWLREERGLSADKAAAIASILRADGLKTGPR